VDKNSKGRKSRFIIWLIYVIIFIVFLLALMKSEAMELFNFYSIPVMLLNNRPALYAGQRSIAVFQFFCQ
jgi:hypothetical protein